MRPKQEKAWGKCGPLSIILIIRMAFSQPLLFMIVCHTNRAMPAASMLTILTNIIQHTWYTIHKLEMHGKAQCVARPLQTRLQNSVFTVPEFTQFSSDTKGSLVVLMDISMLRSFHLLWNDSTQNEGGVCQFLPIRTKNRLPNSNVP